ncbi:Smr/MutS family protein [Aureimonas leprariae]|uniref:DNA mismatch repair protein MutS n=1 Tax=Plantimonas leprariae TaxID=2615207 RepID=A0A7V7TZG1_9HYPH|nr:Smr/MutS family protein [Aureimonas leprariae]KAB0679332.1 DNA mismatch repair protein MutS [Aureimonas leprariae]
MRNRGRRGGLDEEEARLWAGVLASVRPLPGRRIPTVAPLPAAASEPPLAAASPTAPLPSAKAGHPRTTAVPKPALHPIERPVRRKLAKGRLAIDDRIDLHDKTEAVAHYALLGFLRHARATGSRHVLVITGRGSSPGSVGALKRALPHWFDTPDFRALVAGFEPAARGHGGEGAFYVRLRRR